MITMIDYAKPLLDAERSIRDMYNALIHKRFDEAKELGLSAITDIRLAQHAVDHQRGLHDGEAPVGS